MHPKVNPGSATGLLTGQFCMDMLHFQSYYFRLKRSTPVFQKGFSISENLLQS